MSNVTGWKSANFSDANFYAIRSAPEDFIEHLGSQPIACSPDYTSLFHYLSSVAELTDQEIQSTLKWIDSDYFNALLES